MTELSREIVLEHDDGPQIIIVLPGRAELIGKTMQALAKLGYHYRLHRTEETK